MRLFFCLILLSCIFMEYTLTIDDNDFILCTTSSVEVNLKFEEIPQRLQEQQVNDDVTNNQVQALVCGIKYYINYDRQDVTVSFQAVNDSTTLGDQKPAEYLFQKVQLSLSQKQQDQRLVNEITREYHCNTKNDCAKDYYASTISSFLTDLRERLESTKSKLQNDALIHSSSAKRHCTNSNLTGNKTHEFCRTGTCHARYENSSSNVEENKVIQDCVEDYQHIWQPTLLSEIKRYSANLKDKDQELLEFYCNKNVCNRNEMVTKIQDLINSYTRWHHSPNDAKSISEKTGNFSSKQTVCSYFLVLFFLFLKLVV